MKKFLAFIITACLLFASCENPFDSETEDEKPKTDLGLTYSQKGVQLTDSSDKITDISTFNGTVWDCNIEFQIGTITNGVLDLELTAMADNQLYSPDPLSSKGLTFTPSTIKFRDCGWMYVKETGAENAAFELKIDSGNKSWAWFIYTNADTKVGGNLVDTYTYQYDLDLKTGWNWAEWGWPSDAIRTCKTVRSDSYTWQLFDYTPEEEEPETGLGSTYSLNGIQLTETSCMVTNISTFNGTVWDVNQNLQIGTITNGVLDLALPAMTDDKLETADVCFNGLTVSPSTIKSRNCKKMYVKENGASKAAFSLFIDSGNSSFARFIYTNANTKVEGSRTDASCTEQYELDLRTGWNWVEWGSASNTIRTCKSVKSDFYTWILRDIEESKTDLGSTYSRTGIQLTEYTDAIANISSFNGTVWDVNENLQIGTITNGILDLELPAMTDDQLVIPDWWIEQGLTFTPSTIKFKDCAWMFVKETGAESAAYELWINSENNSCVRFIYSNADTKIGGSKPDGTTMTDQYALDLKTGWNWAEWGWPSDAIRTCKTVRSESYTWSLLNR